MALTKLHNKQRMQRLVRFLRNLPSEEFSFNSYITATDEDGCGTVCCAIGWMPKVDPKNCRWCLPMPEVKDSTDTWDTWDGWERYFGITNTEFNALFVPQAQCEIEDSIYLPTLYSSSSATQVADNLDKFIAWKWHA